MSKAIIIRQHDGTEVHRIDVTGKTDREVELVERGLVRQMDTDQYTAAVEEVA